MFKENSIQMYSSFVFKTVEMRWRLRAVEDHFEKHYVPKLYFYFSGLNLNRFKYIPDVPLSP